MTARRKPSIYHSYDPYLLLTGIPNVHGYFPQFGQYSLNSHGFRSREIGPKGHFRIIVVGGSVVWGSGASDNATTFPAGLERKLIGDYGQEVEVINAGVGSYFSFQEFILIAHKLIYLVPDLVIVFDGYNDVFFSSRIPEETYNYNEIQQYKDLQEFLIRSTTGEEFAGGFSFKAVRRMLGSTALGRSMQKLGVAGSKQIYRPNRKGILNYLTNIGMIVDLLKGRGVPVSVCLQPYLPLSKKQMTDVEKSFVEQERKENGKFDAVRLMYGEIESGLKELSIEKGANVHSFLDVFDAESRTCFIDHVHPNDLGYELIAARLAGIVAAKK